MGERIQAKFAACVASILIALPLAFASAAGAAEKVKMSTFQANLCCFTVYVAQHLKLFEKHGVDVELVYGTGIQVANIMISGSAEVGARSNSRSQFASVSPAPASCERSACSSATRQLSRVRSSSAIERPRTCDSDCLASLSRNSSVSSGTSTSFVHGSWSAGPKCASSILSTSWTTASSGRAQVVSRPST